VSCHVITKPSRITRHPRDSGAHTDQLRGTWSAVSYLRVRILVTNDDGVHAPGLAALTRALAEWAGGAPGGEPREVVVVAPLANHSGASAAVGTVFERESVAYRAVPIEGAAAVPVYGLDASPALSVIIGVLGGFGPRPDVVVSGINLGVNVGRSVLHSGTVGAALTGAQLGLSGLAVSLRTGREPNPWHTAASLAVAVLPVVAAAPPRTVLNLNVPAVELSELRGVRRGRVGTAGIIKAAHDSSYPGGATAGTDADAPVDSHRDLAGARGPQPGVTLSGGPGAGGAPEEGEVQLVLGAAVPQLGSTEGEDPEDDASLIAAGFASLTPLLGVRADESEAGSAAVAAALSLANGLLTEA
jgi:5'-nucleotidase